MNWWYVIAGFLFFAWFEGMNAANAEKQAKADQEKARVFAALAACLNGGSIKDQETVINCKRVRR
jgi:hypothetical protein